MNSIQECIDMIENSSDTPSYKFEALRRLKSINENGVFLCRIDEECNNEEYKILVYKNGLKCAPEKVTAKNLGRYGFKFGEYTIAILTDGEYIILGR